MKRLAAVIIVALMAAQAGLAQRSMTHRAGLSGPPDRGAGMNVRAAPQDHLSEARARIDALIKKSGADVAVVFHTLDGTDELLIQPDVEYHAASTMKVPVLIELFRQVKTGALTLDDRIPVVNQFHSIVDGSPFALSVGDDSDAVVYKRVGTTMSCRDLAEAMITVSSNFATNLLIERLGAKNIQHTTDTLGATGMHMLRGVEDDKAFQKGLNNTTTARALATLMEKIANGDAVDRAASREMLAILKRQTFNDRIPAGLPPGIAVAHKTGEITKIQHDAAIVYAERPFSLVVLVRGLQDPKQGSALAADITRVLFYASQARPKGPALQIEAGPKGPALQLTSRPGPSGPGGQPASASSNATAQLLS